MIPLSSDQIRGNWVTVLLPIREDDSIDWDRLASAVDTLIDVKPDGLYCNGTAGEFYNLTESEFDQVADLIAGKCNAAEVPFQIGVSHMSPVISRERLIRTVEYRPSAVQVILPDWYTLTNQEAVDYLQAMAKVAGDIGLVLYNPPHAKRVLSPSDLLFLKQEAPFLVGVKVGCYDQSWKEAMKAVAEVLSVFLPGHLIASGYQEGICHGAYSNMACLNPKAAQVWTDQIFSDLDAALELESRILKFIDGHIFPLVKEQSFANQAVDKLLVEIGQWAPIGLRLRWPYRSVPQKEAERLRPIAQQLLPEFFPSV